MCKQKVNRYQYISLLRCLTTKFCTSSRFVYMIRDIIFANFYRTFTCRWWYNDKGKFDLFHYSTTASFLTGFQYMFVFTENMHFAYITIFIYDIQYLCPRYVFFSSLYLRNGSMSGGIVVGGIVGKMQVSLTTADRISSILSKSWTVKTTIKENICSELDM